jgi:hypothetical protein
MERARCPVEPQEKKKAYKGESEVEGSFFFSPHFEKQYRELNEVTLSSGSRREQPL